MNPRACILRTDGTNCDQETAYAFTKAGGTAELVHMNELRSGTRNLSRYQILAIPGGFSYGDDVASGKVLAVELISFLKDALVRFVESGKLIIGICNGFQILVRTGLLPFKTPGTMQATLVNNDSGRFECRWVDLVVERHTPCVFLNGLKGFALTLMVAHGEGKFFTDNATLERIEKESLVALRYADKGSATHEYPKNPNGSLNAIAGVCDATGRIFGLMPHPERFVEPPHYPNWRRFNSRRRHGLPFFENAIRFAKNL